MKFKNRPTYLDGFLFFEVVDTGADYILSEKGVRGIIALFPFLSILIYKRGYKLSTLDYNKINEFIEIRAIQNEKKRRESKSVFSRFLPIFIVGILILSLLLFGLDIYNIPLLKEIANASLGICVVMIYGFYFYFLKRERKMLEEIIGSPLVLSHQIRTIPVNRKTTMRFFAYHCVAILLFLLGYSVCTSFGNILGLLLSLFSVLVYLFAGEITLKAQLLSISIKKLE